MHTPGETVFQSQLEESIFGFIHPNPTARA